ncbi:putative F-box protein At1g67623 [Arachis hypogaea]|uniref:putative F-box protein At1g67623 n=1 Tax=Arachis hypogaea TaxID=3818 RepID=UPI003B228111
MARGSMNNGRKRKAAKRVGGKGTVSVECECPLNLLPRDIWVRIATRVALDSINDLFNMQVGCKVFLGAARSDAVYKEASMTELPIASFLDNHCLPKHRLIERCVEAGNPGIADAILRQGLTEYFGFARRGIGMELLSGAWTEGSIEAGYMSAMLLLCT